MRGNRRQILLESFDKSHSKDFLQGLTAAMGRMTKWEPGGCGPWVDFQFILALIGAFHLEERVISPNLRQQNSYCFTSALDFALESRVSIRQRSTSCTPESSTCRVAIPHCCKIRTPPAGTLYERPPPCRARGEALWVEHASSRPPDDLRLLSSDLHTPPARLKIAPSTSASAPGSFQSVPVARTCRLRLRLVPASPLTPTSPSKSTRIRSATTHTSATMTATTAMTWRGRRGDELRVEGSSPTRSWSCGSAWGEGRDRRVGLGEAGPGGGTRGSFGVTSTGGALGIRPWAHLRLPPTLSARPTAIKFDSTELLCFAHDSFHQQDFTEAPARIYSRRASAGANAFGGELCDTLPRFPLEDGQAMYCSDCDSDIQLVSQASPRSVALLALGDWMRTQRAQPLRRIYKTAGFDLRQIG
ncbi:hypothetical protein C8R45DRAFT_927628 [Mycena sanguinolenta]|nr:hypothetical protein C8R45DRAFT_927628 [Mycena sanguinolenta]